MRIFLSGVRAILNLDLMCMYGSLCKKSFFLYTARGENICAFRAQKFGKRTYFARVLYFFFLRGSV